MGIRCYLLATWSNHSTMSSVSSGLLFQILDQNAQMRSKSPGLIIWSAQLQKTTVNNSPSFPQQRSLVRSVFRAHGFVGLKTHTQSGPRTKSTAPLYQTQSIKFSLLYIRWSPILVQLLSTTYNVGLDVVSFFVTEKALLLLFTYFICFFYTHLFYFVTFHLVFIYYI